MKNRLRKPKVSYCRIDFSNQTLFVSGCLLHANAAALMRKSLMAIPRDLSFDFAVNISFNF